MVNPDLCCKSLAILIPPACSCIAINLHCILASALMPPYRTWTLAFVGIDEVNRGKSEVNHCRQAEFSPGEVAVLWQRICVLQAWCFRDAVRDQTLLCLSTEEMGLTGAEHCCRPPEVRAATSTTSGSMPA